MGQWKQLHLTADNWERCCTSDSPDGFIATIEPDAAEAILRKKYRNRQLNKHNIDRYAKALSDGTWRVNSSAIGFDRLGRLIDGQNRLTACCTADTAMQTFVHTGLDTVAIYETDTGGKRIPAQTLKIMGYKNAENTAAISAAYLRYKAYGEEFMASNAAHMKRPITTTEVVELLKTDKGHEIESVASWFGAKKFITKICTTSTAGALKVITHERCPEDSDYFFDRLDNPFDPPYVGAIQLYAKWALNYKGQKKTKTVDQQYMLAVLIKTWNMYMKGDTPSSRKLGWHRGGARPEPYPKIYFGEER